MWLTAELLLHYQRCSRRAFLDVYGDLNQRDPPSDYLLKLLQDSYVHRQLILAEQSWEQPQYPRSDWVAGAAATLKLMQQGVERIRQGVLLKSEGDEFTLLAIPDLLVKHPGQSVFGDWLYVPTDIKLGKRPKLEYQIIAAYHTYVLAAVQGAWPETAWLLLREKGAYQVDLWTVMPQMQVILGDCLQTLGHQQEPEVFISRNRCNLCHWFSHCYGIAQDESHLSLLPGVTASRYTQLKAVNIKTIASLAETSPDFLEPLPGFGRETAHKVVRQAQATVENRVIPRLPQILDLAKRLPTSEVELYFDIEAEPELNVAYLQGVLVVNRKTAEETFYPLLAETPEEEPQIWQQFLSLVWDYPQAPIYHFCPYEMQTVERLGKLYNTPPELIRPLLSRFIDLHDLVTNGVTLPVESYALKHIARYLGFDWRNSQANGAQSICWYTQWLTTGDRHCLEAIVDYNEDDCRAMYRIKNWLVELVGELCSAAV